MTKRIYIDFESRSQADIWSVGAYNYAAHPTTEILCMCLAIDDSPVYFADFHDSNLVKFLNFLIEQINEGAEFHAHNAFFEQAIWKCILTPKYGVPEVPLSQWRCTMAKANAHALPQSLEKCGLALECKFKKDMVGSKVMKKLSTTTGKIAQADMQRLIDYCIIDVELEREIDKKLPDLTPREQKLWFLDQHINFRGIKVDLPATNIAVQVIKDETEKLAEELYLLTAGRISAGTQTIAMRDWLEEKGLNLPDLTKKTVKEAVEKASPREKRVLELRQLLSLTSNAKYQALQSFSSEDGRVRDTLVYHGASTGRWTGKAVQIQNLPRPISDKFDNIEPISTLYAGAEKFQKAYGNSTLATLSSCLRGMFLPTEGHDMFITDFASIEARVVMWLADEEQGVQAFVDGDKDPKLPDIYVKMARQIYGNPALVKANKAERQVGKQAVLGAGYGMGPAKFQITCENYGIPMTEDLATRSIYGYRNLFSKVPQLWQEIEQKAIAAVRLKGEKIPVKECAWQYVGDFLRLWLPSGRSLAYHYPKIKDGKLTFMGVNSITKKYEVETIWGGTLTENAVQAIARDFMADTMINFMRNGFEILFTVHDELVVEAIKGTKTCDDVLAIVRQVPIWGLGCPINAECEKVSRYKK